MWKYYPENKPNYSGWYVTIYDTKTKKNLMRYNSYDKINDIWKSQNGRLVTVKEFYVGPVLE